MRSFALLVALALAAVPALTGCDEVAPTTTQDLLTDARIARQAGDLDTAIDLLERAHAADPADAVVRVELATTLFEKADLGISDLDQIATFLYEEGISGSLNLPEPVADASAKGGCPYADAPGSEPFDPRDLAEYSQYLDRTTVARRVRELLDPVITEELRPDDFLCNGVVDGALNYDPDAALESLQAVDSRLTNDQIASALAVNAVAEVMDSYLFLAGELEEETDWYRLANGNIGICPVGVSETELRDLAEESIADLGEALVSIDLRAHILGSSQVSTELVDIMLDAYDEVRDDLAPYCPGS